MKNLKSHVITVRVDDRTYLRLQSDSDQDRISVSELIRKMIIGSYDSGTLKRIEDKIDKLLVEGSDGEAG